LISPATEAHIAKYSMLETAEDWQNTTSPHIKAKSFDLTVKIEFVYMSILFFK